MTIFSIFEHLKENYLTLKGCGNQIGLEETRYLSSLYENNLTYTNEIHKFHHLAQTSTLYDQWFGCSKGWKTGLILDPSQVLTYSTA